MPGKHAPASPRSFYFSIAKLAAAVIGAALVVGLIAASVIGPTAPKQPRAAATTTPTATASATPTPTVSQSHTPSPTATPLRKRSAVTVLVLNATSRSGLAGRVSDSLEAEGYRKRSVGNDDDAATSVVYYRSGYRAEAARLADDLGIGSVKKAPSGLQGSARLTVVLGADFKE